MRRGAGWWPAGLVTSIVVSVIWSPVVAHGAAVFEAEVYYNSDSTDAYDAASDWSYYISDSEPSDADSCLDDGTAVPYLIDTAVVEDGLETGIEEDAQAPTTFDVISVDPPFSASSSSTKYVTACYDTSHYIVLEMTVALTDCVLWVCTSTFTSSIVSGAGSGYSTSGVDEYLTYSIGIVDIAVPQLGS